MYQHETKGKTQPEKSTASAPAANKNHAQAGTKPPVQTRSFFSPSAKPNNTGIPLQMKEKFENLSGFSFDDVRIHYNSDKPAQLQALAYTQGNQVYVAPGQEKHLGHELGHVVQQKQGRVRPTMQLQGMGVNDDERLEREADDMGAAVQMAKGDDLEKDENSGAMEIRVDQLPEEDAHKYLADSFKRGKIKNPVVNKEGKIIQMLPRKQSWSGGDLFTVLYSDLDSGTGTTSATRDYVNNPSTIVPDEILFDYFTSASTARAMRMVKGNKTSHKIDNPIADYSYKSGSYWDAGHKLGRQNGGLGNDNDWVFPQNPAYNQGNSKNMKDTIDTRPLWRADEDAFYNGVKKDGGGVWWIKLL